MEGTVGAGAIVMLSAFEAVWPTLSVTFTVKENVPATVGVPLITPVDDAKVRPAGKLPDVIDHA
jgi:hypothetical protein